MRPMVFFFVAAAFLVSTTFSARDFTAGVTSKLQVTVPKSLAKSGGYKHREALFGVPPYGHSMEQNVYYADSTLCTHDFDPRGGYPIRPKDSDGEMMPWPSPFFLMVDRGHCPFISQVRNAQHAGAAGVIVANYLCLCSAIANNTCDQGEITERCENHVPVMTDSGFGVDVTIPTFLLYKEDVDPIRRELMSNHAVRVKMSWPLPAPDDRVEYDLWTTPVDGVSREFLRDFKEGAIALGKHAYFTPHMYLYSGEEMGCGRNDFENRCRTRCTNFGKYCAANPTEGGHVVRESLRRLCAWNLYGKEDGIGVIWWDYVKEFTDRCSRGGNYAKEDCVKEAMEQAGMDYDKVENCISDSGGLVGNVKNTILEEQLAAKETSRVVLFPDVFVNETPLRGALGFATVFKAICAGFIQGSLPKICEECANCADPMACVQAGEGTCVIPAVKVEGGGGGGGAGGNIGGSRGGSTSSTSSASGTVQVIPITEANGRTSRKRTSPFWTFFMFVMAAGVGAYTARRYRKVQDNEMRDHVRGILADYMPLEGEIGSIGSPTDLSNSSAAVSLTSREGW